MHSSCYEWVGRIVRQHDLAERATLEVGSFNVNGTIRDHFDGQYLAVDSQAGPGVDFVADAERLHERLALNDWQVVVSTEMFEHVDRPWLAMRELADACAPGGHVIVTCRGYDERGCWPVHDYPRDVWRYSARSLRVLAEDAGLEVLDLVTDPEGPGWFLLARKEG